MVGWPTTDPEPAADEALALGSSSSLPSAVPEPVPDVHTEPIDERAIEDIVHAEDVAHGTENDDDEEPEEDEWEWEIAVARARASEPPPIAEQHAARPMRATQPPQVIEPPTREPVLPVRESPPTDPSRPRTVIPVPTLPSGAVRSYEPPRFARATNRSMPVASPLRTSARR